MLESYVPFVKSRMFYFQGVDNMRKGIEDRREDCLDLVYASLGLVGEAGEIANKVKKVMRDNNGYLSLKKRDELISELGDVLFYCVAMCSELETTMEEVMQKNREKLDGRHARGTLGGSGDER